MNIRILQLIEGAKAARGLTVIIDVFRAFSVEAYLLANGAKKIIPIANVEEAYRLKSENPDYILAGERHGAILPGFDLGNSPSVNNKSDVVGKNVVHTTSAGTQGVDNARGATEILGGSPLNAAATADYIRKSGADDVCVVVTRYFGGILLGAGGLVRAYSHSAVIAINEAEIVVYEPYCEYRLVCGYSEYQKYSNLLGFEKVIIDSTDFEDVVKVSFAVKKTQSERILTKISELGYGRDIPELVGERFDCR